MAAFAPTTEDAERIDRALQEWRQGDLALGETWFVHLGDPAVPLSDASSAAAGEGVQALESQVEGLVVVTQTCDIVRSCVVRPYIELMPLVKVCADDFHSIARGRRPALAALPSLKNACLVVDLDRVMTVEKSVIATWERTPGYTQDADARAFARALARKRVRFAFPDDFTELAKKLQTRLGEKHDRDSVEGQGLRALREIRVLASPSWGAPQVNLFFWFVRESTELPPAGKSWAELLEKWLELTPPTGRFVKVEGLVVDLPDMSAADYVDSDPLDLDHLSSRRV